MFRSVQDHHQALLWIKSVMLRTCWDPNCVFQVVVCVLSALQHATPNLKAHRTHTTPTVNTVGIPTCTQHYWRFIRRPDDGPVGTETCSLPFIKYDVPDVNCFIILITNWVMHCQTAKVEEYNQMRFWICLIKVYYCKNHVKFNHNHHSQYCCH
jgi:hypothetical protein